MAIRSSPGRIVAVVLAVVFIICLLPNTRETYRTYQYSFLPSLPLTQPDAASLPSSLRISPLKERMALSEKSWQRSVEGRHQMAAAHPSNPQVPFFPTDFLKSPFTVWDFFPPTWTCPHDVQRVGRLGDGGKWVCGMSRYEALPAPVFGDDDFETINGGLVIYSFGINGESSFEAEMLERIPSSRIWGYDFSVDGWGPQIPAQYRNRTFFEKVGLGDEDDATKSPPFYTLPTLMAKNNHTYIDILKIDVEGAEYTAFDSIMDFFDSPKNNQPELKERDGKWAGVNWGVLPIGQVMIELHLDDNKVDFERFSGWWERLERMGMRPTWMEINLFAVTLGREKSDPRCSEYVWVNAKDGRNVLWRD